MATLPTQTHLPPLGGHVRDEVGRLLQDSLVELLALSLIGKQLHWSVTGPLFRTVHTQLDELVDAWRDLADTVAERAVAIGVWPDGRAPSIVAGSGLTPVERGPVTDREVIRLLSQRIAEVAERSRVRMERLADLDAASQDVTIAVVRTLEQQLWMVRAQLPS